MSSIAERQTLLYYRLARAMQRVAHYDIISTWRCTFSSVHAVHSLVAVLHRAVRCNEQYCSRWKCCLRPEPILLLTCCCASWFVNFWGVHQVATNFPCSLLLKPFHMRSLCGGWYSEMYSYSSFSLWRYMYRYICLKYQLLATEIYRVWISLGTYLEQQFLENKATRKYSF